MATIIKCVITACGWSLLAGTCHAQYAGGQFGRGPTPFSRPTVSPYLNLLQGGNPAINYYGLVRPQLAFRNALQNLGENVNTIGNNVNSLETNQPTQTGHRSSFMTQGAYFMTNGSGVGAMRQRGLAGGTGYGLGSGQSSGGYSGGAGASGALRSPSSYGIR